MGGGSDVEYTQGSCRIDKNDSTCHKQTEGIVTVSYTNTYLPNYGFVYLCNYGFVYLCMHLDKNFRVVPSTYS